MILFPQCPTLICLAKMPLTFPQVESVLSMTVIAEWSVPALMSTHEQGLMLYFLSLVQQRRREIEWLQRALGVQPESIHHVSFGQLWVSRSPITSTSPPTSTATVIQAVLPRADDKAIPTRSPNFRSSILYYTYSSQGTAKAKNIDVIL